MSTKKTVTVIGGGVAGLSAAVFLNERGFDVTLFEASPKLGGRAYSFFDKDKNQFFDNGQHILAGWYKNTFEYLKLTGSYNNLNFQNELEVNFINTDKKIFKLKCSDDSPPLNLIKGLLKFGAFGFKDKFALKNINKLLPKSKKDNEDFINNFANVRELLTGIKQTPALIKYFWEPFTLAVFNSRLENISIKIFLNVLKTGFDEKNSAMLVIPGVNLNELIVNNAVKYFKERKIKIVKDSRVRQIFMNGEKAEYLLMESGDKIYSDFYVSAVSFFAFKKLFDEKIYYENNFKSELLKPSGIISVHLFPDENISDEMIPTNSFGMTGLIGTIVQWIFKRGDRHLSLVISGADELQITDMSHEDIFKLCLKDLNMTIKGFENLNIKEYRVIKEKRATFIPDYASDEYRPAQKTRYSNFFISGDWTDTGFPATIESAVTSSMICSELIVNSQN